MDIKLRLFLIFLLVLSLYLIVATIKKKDLSMKYGMYLTLIFGGLLILIIFPNIIEVVAKFCGFKEAPNLLFLISIFILFGIIFRMYATITKMQRLNKSLVQELSILKKEIKERIK